MRQQIVRLLLIAIVMSISLSIAGCGSRSSAQGDTPVFTFTAIPDQDEQHLRERFSRIADYLAKTLNVAVQYVPVKSYPAAVSAFENNAVQLAWFGGLSGVQARNRVPGSKAIVQGAEDAHFRSYFIVNTSTGIEPSADFPKAIKGLSFTFGAKGSTSGRLMPEHFIREAFDAAPDDMFSRVGFSGDHSRTIQLVQSGAYQAGALNYAVWDRDVKRGVVDTDKVRVLWKTPPYPDYQFTIRGDVDKTFGEGFSARVRKALVGLDDKTLLDVFPRSAFIPASNEDYAPIREVGEQLGLVQ